MQMLYTRELGRANEDRPRGRLRRASATNGNGLPRGLPEVSARAKELIPQPSERTNSHSAGLILLDASLRPLNADEEAVSILSYPETPRRNKGFDNLLVRRIDSLLPKPNGNQRPRFSTVVTSGKRQYQLRVFTLKSHMANGAGPSLAILLERNHRAPLDLGLVAQEFRLTQRETETLGLLMQGHATKQIACRMDISPNTAKAFLRSLMFKTGACDRSGILARILQFSQGASG